MRVYILIIFLLLQSGCSLFSPVTIREIPLPPAAPEDCVITYSVETINPLTGAKGISYGKGGESCSVALDRTGETYIRILPEGLNPHFKPLPLGGVLDPRDEFPTILSPAGGVVYELVMLLEDQGFQGDFNYQRLNLEIRDRLDGDAWKLDIEYLAGEIRKGEFSSSDLRISDMYSSLISFDSGFWISEDPGRPAVETEEAVLVELFLSSGRGIRYLELYSGRIKEIYCNEKGRFLVMDL